MNENKFKQELVKIPSLNSQHFVLRATPWGREFGLNWFLVTGTSTNQEVSVAEAKFTADDSYQHNGSSHSLGN